MEVVYQQIHILKILNYKKYFCCLAARIYCLVLSHIICQTAVYPVSKGGTCIHKIKGIGKSDLQMRYNSVPLYSPISDILFLIHRILDFIRMEDFIWVVWAI